MEREKKQPEADDISGAPEWMVTFSDCMTLLLTFFVLLLTFSSFDNRIFRKLRVVYSTALTTITPSLRSDRDSLVYTPPIIYTAEIDKGSEQNTLSEDKGEGLLKETGTSDLMQSFVFIFPSNKLFWGNGPAVSTEGCQIIDNVASFLKEVPHRIVIAENNPEDDQNSEDLGLQRSMAIMNYLTEKQNLDKKRFSISSNSIVAQNNITKMALLSASKAKPQRNIEIVLLTRSVYN